MGNIPHFGEFSFASSQTVQEISSQEFASSQDSVLQSQEQDPPEDGANLNEFNFRDGCTIVETVAKKDTVEVFDPQGQFSQNGNQT